MKIRWEKAEAISLMCTILTPDSLPSQVRESLALFLQSRRDEDQGQYEVSFHVQTAIE